MSAVRWLAVGFCLFASAAAAQSPAPNPGAGGKSICVASALGHRYEIQTIGLMVFGNELQWTAVDSWGIDDLVVRQIGAILGKGYVVRRVNFPPGTIAAIETRRSGELFRNRNDELTAAVRAAAASAPKCDFYISVTRGAGQVANTNQTIEGLGVLKRGAGILHRYEAFAVVFIRRYDANTFAVTLPKFDVGKALLEGLTGTGLRGPYRDIDEADWPTTPQAAVQSAKLRGIARALVDSALARAVPSLF